MSTETPQPAPTACVIARRLRELARQFQGETRQLLEDAALLLNEPLPAPTVWRSIETAPKDGTKVDLWAKNWMPAFDQFGYQRFPDCYWREADTLGSWKAGWQNISKDWYPTHWMPLPEPPQ